MTARLFVKSNLDMTGGNQSIQLIPAMGVSAMVQPSQNRREERGELLYQKV